MGNHYVPQYYLKGFSADGGETVWAYDKADRRVYRAHTRNVATQTRFYSADLESYLANSVEDPAKPVIEKIRARVQISIQEKQTLAAYMICMMNRVPEGKKRTKLRAPSVKDEVIADIDRRLNVFLRQNPHQAELVEKRRSETHELIERYAKDAPDDLWFRTILRAKQSQVLPLLSSMTWRFLTFDRYPAFITSDNPVFFFTENGLVSPDSELSFPISSHVSLWATHRSDFQDGFSATTEQAVKELNRRTASRATRFAFHSIEEPWVMTLLTRRSPQLHLFR